MYIKLCHVFDEKEWHYKKDDEKLQITCGVSGEDLPMDLRFEVDVDRQLLLVLSGLPYAVAENKRLDVAIAVSVVNHRLFDGNFDFDIRNGTLGFRMTQSYMESDIGEEALDAMIFFTCRTIDDYNDKFFGISKGMLSLEQFVSAEYAE